MRPKLFFYDETAPIFLLTDASDYGIGGYLYQLVNGKEQPVAFVSKSLSGPQLRWLTIQKRGIRRLLLYYPPRVSTQGQKILSHDRLCQPCLHQQKCEYDGAKMENRLRFL